MKREDIENAARRDSNLWLYTPREVSDIYRKMDYEEGYVDGAIWHIRSVWHSNYRIFKAKTPALVIFKNGKAKVYDDLVDLTIKSLWDEVDKFAYIEDLTDEIED